METHIFITSKKGTVENSYDDVILGITEFIEPEVEKNSFSIVRVWNYNGDRYDVRTKEVVADASGLKNLVAGIESAATERFDKYDNALPAINKLARGKAPKDISVFETAALIDYILHDAHRFEKGEYSPWEDEYRAFNFNRFGTTKCFFTNNTEDIIALEDRLLVEVMFY